MVKYYYFYLILTSIICKIVIYENISEYCYLIIKQIELSEAVLINSGCQPILVTDLY